MNDKLRLGAKYFCQKLLKCEVQSLKDNDSDDEWWLLTWTEGDDGAGLSLYLNSDPIVHLLISRAGSSSSLWLRTATTPVAGHRLCPTGPGARSPL